MCIGKYAKSERVALPSEHDLQGKILSEQMVREILEEVAELRKQNKQLINAAFNICEEYKGCEGCPLHDAKEYKCKLLDSYPEPKEAIHEYIQRIYRG